VILEYRGLAKLRSTYTDKLPEMVNPDTGRVHTSYHQSGAATGRLSSSDPNLQNIPIRTEDGRRIRRAFVAGGLPAAGGRLFADRAADHGPPVRGPGPGACLRAGRRRAPPTAAEVFGRTLEEVTPNERRAAKAINFGLMYGMSAFGLARNLGIDRGQAQDYVALYFSRYPGVRDFMERMRQQARDQGYVETLFGRRLYLNDIMRATRACAPVPNARRSTRRCRAPPPTSSSARWWTWTSGCGQRRTGTDDPAGAR
jgi:DNA polymerase-1